MPVATVNTEEFQRFDLKTAPPDGFVMLRPLPFGMKLERRDNATKMSMEQKANKRGRRAQQEEVAKIEVATLSEWSTLYDFRFCIGDHNLTDANGNKLDLGSPMTLKALDPRIGSEIEACISSLNDDEDDESLEVFTKRATLSSTNGQNESKKSSETDTENDMKMATPKP